MSVIFGIIFFLTYLGIDKVVKENTKEFLTKQYSYLNDKVLGAFGSLYEDLNSLTADFITNDYVQKTLTNQPITPADRDMLEKTLSYYNKSFLDSYLVIDNKGNLYSQKDVQLDMEKFKKSTIYKSLGDDYSKTKILWTRDVIFGTNEMSFFAVRYIHEMNSVHDAGVLILKLNDHVMNAVRESAENEELAYFIVNPNQEVCFKKLPDSMGENWQQELEEVFAEEYEENDGGQSENGRADAYQADLYQPGTRQADAGQQTEDKILISNNLKAGILSGKTDEKTQFTVITYAPGSITNHIIREIQLVMGLIFGFMFVLTVLGVAAFTETMHHFPGNAMPKSFP